MKTKNGFTLIELLVAVAIIAVISLFSTQMLFDTLSTRSKQTAITQADENLRTVLNKLSAQIMTSRAINIPDPTVIEIRGETCQTYRFNMAAQTIEMANDSSENCVPPVSGFESITDAAISVENVVFAPESSSPTQIDIQVTGTYHDTINDHPFSYQTTVTPRIR